MITAPGGISGSYTIPGSVTSIGGYAFDDCDSLAAVTIQDGVTSIGDYAFRDCDSLTKVTIPGSVTSIGGYAFYNCGSLKEIFFKGNAPVFWRNDVFENVTATAYYPGNDPTWTEEVRQNYGGNITWVAYQEENPAPDVLLGDVTGDGKVTAADYSRLLAHVKKVNLITDEASLKAADVTGDGKVTAADYSRLLAHVKKINLLW